MARWGILARNLAPACCLLGLLSAVGCGSRRTTEVDVDSPVQPHKLAGPDVSALIAALGSGDSDVRFAAVLTLGQWAPQEGEEAIPALARLLTDPNDNVRSSAADVLGRYGSKAAVAADALGRALKDPDESVRVAAATALGRIGPRASSAVAALMGATKDGSEEVRRLAAKSVWQIDPKAAERAGLPRAG